MDHHLFDEWTRNVPVGVPPRNLSRRSALKATVGVGLAAVLARLGLQQAAAVCLKLDRPCRHARECCSGICTGKHGKKTCHGHGIGTCRPGQGFCQAGADVACNGDESCVCFQTTAGTTFCSGGGAAGNACADCERDADCVAQAFPPGSACVSVDVGFSEELGLCPNTGGRVCAVPCGI